MPKLPDDVAIRVNNIHKDFYLPHHADDSIKRKIITAFQPKDKEVDTQHALRGITFDIKKGEFFGIVGRNGSGKSTLLKIISDIYQPTKGSVTRSGKLVAFIELGVGFNNELTGRENIYLNAALLGFSRKETNDMYKEIVAFAELENFMEQKLKNYSSGMKVRLAFSVAIRANADILILDEVLAVGDADFQRKCFEYFRDLKEQKDKTIVFVTHGMGAVREYCDKVILIEDGVITHQGDADKIANEYLKLFNRSADSNLGDKRWGDQTVTIKKFKTKIDNNKIVFDVSLYSKIDTKDNVKFGFKVKNNQNKVIAGANNINVEGGQKLQFKAGETRILNFSMPNIFGNETYKVSATVNLSDGATTYDNWDDITSFSNTKDQVFYPVVCPAVLKIT